MQNDKKNYKLPFIDIFSASLDKKEPCKVVYTHKWAREGGQRIIYILKNFTH